MRGSLKPTRLPRLRSFCISSVRAWRRRSIASSHGHPCRPWPASWRRASLSEAASSWASRLRRSSSAAGSSTVIRVVPAPLSVPWGERWFTPRQIRLAHSTGGSCPPPVSTATNSLSSLAPPECYPPTLPALHWGNGPPRWLLARGRPRRTPSSRRACGRTLTSLRRTPAPERPLYSISDLTRRCYSRGPRSSFTRSSTL